jgi:hypothetical protein
MVYGAGERSLAGGTANLKYCAFSCGRRTRQRKKNGVVVRRSGVVLDGIAVVLGRCLGDLAVQQRLS